jgi:hypothetical protein
MGTVLCPSRGGVKWARFPVGDAAYPYKACPRHAGVMGHSVSISQCFLHCLVNTQKQARHVCLCAPIVKSRLISSMYCWETLGYGKH